MKKDLSKTAEKLLASCFELRQHKKIASMDGLIKILQGKIDEETVPLKKYKSFGQLVSLRSKRAKMLFHQLVRNGYLDQKYIEGDYFLALTKLGMKIGREAYSKLPLKKKEKSRKRTIVAISEGTA